MQSVFIPSLSLFSCWHGWSWWKLRHCTLVNSRDWTALPDNTKLGMGSSSELFWILAIPCGAIEKGAENDEKVSHFYLGFVFLILYLPISIWSFMPSIRGDMNAFTGFTLEHFNELFADSCLMLILSETFLLAFLSALIMTVIGTLEPFISTNRRRS